MKTLLVIFCAVSLLGCSSPLIVYSRHQNLNWLTIETQGDDLTDFKELKRRAEELCFQDGLKHGINVTYAHASDSITGTGTNYYTIAYYCR